VIPHFHHVVQRRGLPSYVCTNRERPETGEGECYCEGGEETIYHDLIVEDGELDEQCPCADCQADRIVRFKRWRAEQEKAVRA
jgi:hypothetical protein